MLKLKLQYFGHLMQRADSLEKTLILGKIGSKRRTGQCRMKWLDSITNSVQFSRSVMSDTLQPHRLQHARLPCPSPTPGACSNSCPIESVMPSSHLILCRPLLLLPPIPPSIRVFSSESTLRMRWPKYWSFSFSVIPSKEIPGLISFRMDWLNLLAVQGTLKSLLQHHSTKALILWHSAFFLHNPTLTSIHDHWKNHSLD